MHAWGPRLRWAGHVLVLRHTMLPSVPPDAAEKLAPQSLLPMFWLATNVPVFTPRKSSETSAEFLVPAKCTSFVRFPHV